MQHLIPTGIVVFLYAKISHFLASLPLVSSTITKRRQTLTKRRRNVKMFKRTAAIYFLSWLPLNLINLSLVFFDSDDTPIFSDIEHMYIAYTSCHFASMTSVLLNPILYGLMNEKFRPRFIKIWGRLRLCRNGDPTQDVELDLV